MVELPLPFDVFLAHNSKDKPQVRAISEKLKKLGLKPWIDEEQIPPGRSFQEQIQLAISQVKSATIFIGSEGLGKWQTIELQALVDQYISKDSPVIPVLLPGVDMIPENLIFLRQFNWVSFKSIEDREALDNLAWGISGEKTKPLSEISSQDFEPDEVELLSERGVDYTYLSNLLKNQKWWCADIETSRLLLKAVNKSEEEYRYLSYGNIDHFSCTDLKTIDDLWVRYSNGHFGFSIQKDIYTNLNGIIPKQNIFVSTLRKAKFKKQFMIGNDYLRRVLWLKDDTDAQGREIWRDTSDIIYDLNAPKGHLPYIYLQNNRKIYLLHSEIPRHLMCSDLSLMDRMLGGDAWGNWQRRVVIPKLFSRLETCKL